MSDHMNEEFVVYDDIDNHRDDEADIVMQSCCNLQHPKSFFLFAGAGSGKTRSLITTLSHINKEYGEKLQQEGRKIAVITYTNAACDEIKRRAEYNPLFCISTIHSFAWTLISPHTQDIKEWLQQRLAKQVLELSDKQKTGRPTSQAFKDRAKKIDLYKKRIEYLPNIKKFIYNPDGNNIEKNSLDHAEVISITADFLTEKQTLQLILVDRYPILLIDESQDTKKELIDAFLLIQSHYSYQFTIGLLGDTMQRIYMDGKENLSTLIPAGWERPVKIMNHRSRKRIVALCNSIRKSVDGVEQESRHNRTGGFIRVFITSNSNPLQAEKDIRIHMATETDDDEWNNLQAVKCLTVEHQMAAKRLGFNTFFEPLNSINSYKQGLMNGSLSVMSVLTRIALPLYEAYTTDDQFEIMRIVREYSLIFADKKGQLSSKDIVDLRRKINTLTRLWDNNDPKCIDLIKCIYEENLFNFHDDIKLLINHTASDGVEDPEAVKLDSLAISFNARFSEVKKYQEYIEGKASFDTHQGVKGLEFPRVMVIIDDSSTRGSSFNYNKLFGIEKKSDTDIRNEAEGRETTIERTKRLLYVTCSRAIDSLAIVYYTTDIVAAIEAVSSSGWFEENEIIPL